MSVTLEAEQGLLGCLFYEKTVFEKVCDIVSPEMFESEAHADIYRVYRDAALNGQHLTPITIFPKFQNDERFKAVGGAKKYIVEMAASFVSLANAQDYAMFIRDRYRERKLALVLSEVQESIKQGNDVTETIDLAEREIFSLRDESKLEFSDAHEAWHEATVLIDDMRSGKIQPIKSGLGNLDKIIGGFSGGRLYIVAARPAMGKTAFALNLAEQATTHGDVLFFSMEMPKTELAMRLAARKTGVNVQKQATGNLKDNELDLIAKYKAPDGLVLFDKAGIGINEIVALSRRFARVKKAKMIIIDYLGLIRGDSRLQKVHQIEEITTRLKALSKDLDVPIVLLSQLSRAVELRDDNRPILADLRDSGSIEQDADVVMFLYREEYYEAKRKIKQGEKEKEETYLGRVRKHEEHLERIKGQADVIIAKNRQGLTDTAKLMFDGERQFFYDRGF